MRAPLILAVRLENRERLKRSRERETRGTQHCYI